LTAVHGTFNTVVWVVGIAGAVVAVVGLIATRKTWQDFGKDALMMDSEVPRPSAAGFASPNQERDEEIRQMLEARNARRIRRGERPLDVEDELAKLTAPLVDPELRKEIRDLVIARNYRRTRAGRPALDVDAEVEREIARLVG
jgi:hypothetical protein